MKCGYSSKGCAKGEGCDRKMEDCSIARHFDYLVARSTECKNNFLPTDQFVQMWRDRRSTIDKCEGCRRTEGGYCSAYSNPAVKWPRGEVSYENKCALATHVKPSRKKGKKVNALKASKRAGGRR
jgi:hypothetical protein